MLTFWSCWIKVGHPSVRLQMATQWVPLKSSPPSSSVLDYNLSDLAWLHPADVLSCCSWTQYHSKHKHTQSCTELLSHSCTARGPLCCKGATWGPKSSVGVGWLCNLIAWIVFLFFFFVVKFLFFCSFLASSCASYSRQASTSPDITARLLGDNVIGWPSAYDHMIAALNILVPL